MSKFECGECSSDTRPWDLCSACTNWLDNSDEFCARCTVASHAVNDIYCSHCRLFLAQESQMIDAFIAMKVEG